MQRQSETIKAKAVRLLTDNVLMSTAELQAEGIHRTALTRLTNNGVIERVSSGQYRMADAAFEQWESFAVLSKRTDGIICLLSAAEFHGMTQMSVGRTFIAVEHERGVPRLENVEIDVSRWRWDIAHTLGIETHTILGVEVKITNPARTLVDLFRMSNLNASCRDAAAKITDEMFLDALFRYFDQDRGGDVDVDAVTRLAEAFCSFDAIAPYIKTAQYASQQGFAVAPGM